MTAYTESNVSMRAGFDPSSGSNFPSDLDAFYNPDEEWISDQLDQARMNRCGFYQRLQNSTARAHAPTEEDIRFQSSSGSRKNATREKSISDGGPSADSIPKMPEPHTSWRFYTSYDNGEWRRHAVPVYHSEEDIMKEGKSTRKEKDLLAAGAESSLRRMRMNRPSGIESLQIRRSGGTGDGMRNRTLSDGGRSEAVKVDVLNLTSPLGQNQRRRTEGGLRVIYPRNSLPETEEDATCGGFSHSECYTAEYKETRNAGRPVQTVSGKDATVSNNLATVPSKEAVRVNRPRIYGFQEKIIIPTKYKTAAELKEKEKEAEKNAETAAGNSETAAVSRGNVETAAVSQGNLDSKGERKDVVSHSSRSVSFGIENQKVDIKGKSDGKMENKGREVKVVIVNSDDEKSGKAEKTKRTVKFDVGSTEVVQIPVVKNIDIEKHMTVDDFFQNPLILENKFQTKIIDASDKDNKAVVEEKKFYTETINIWNPGKQKEETVYQESCSFVSGIEDPVCIKETRVHTENTQNTDTHIVAKQQDGGKTSTERGSLSLAGGNQHVTEKNISDIDRNSSVADKDKYVSVVRTQIIRDNKSDGVQDQAAGGTSLRQSQDSTSMSGKNSFVGGGASLKSDGIQSKTTKTTVNINLNKEDKKKRYGISASNENNEDWAFEMAVKK